jgi:hypothetical protein
VEVLDPEDHVVGQVEKSAEVVNGASQWKAELKLDKPVALDELVWHRVRYGFVYNNAKVEKLQGMESISNILRCCTSLIMSPSGLVRNVPYTVTSRGGPVEEDSDEHEGTSAGRGDGTSEEQGSSAYRCGEDVGVELPADEETLEAISRRRSPGTAAPQCGERFEPCQAGEVPAEGAAVDPEEVFGNRAGALWADAGRGTLSGRGWTESGRRDAATLDASGGFVESNAETEGAPEAESTAGALW